MDRAVNGRRLEMFSREDTKAIKGAAIVLMLFHHLAGFPDRLPAGFGGFDSVLNRIGDGTWLVTFALCARLCVPVFFFLGGYGLYQRRQAQKFRLSDAVLTLYRQYWKVFVIFIPIAFLFFERSGDGISALCTRYEIVHMKDTVTAVAGDFIGYTCTLNEEWWFFRVYLCMLFLGCLFCLATEKQKNVLADLFFVLAADVLALGIFPGLMKLEAFEALKDDIVYRNFFALSERAALLFFAGIVFAKYDLLVMLKKRLGSTAFPGLLSLAGCAAVFMVRACVLQNRADLFCTPAFVVFASTLLDRIRPLKKVFVFLGRHSTNMWLVHSFYCYYFLEATKLVYLTTNVWIDLLTLIAMSLATSVLLEYFWKNVGRILDTRIKRIASALSRSGAS